eukprot:2235047-Pyramimonas_sp.AAC.1
MAAILVERTAPQPEVAHCRMSATPAPTIDKRRRLSRKSFARGHPEPLKLVIDMGLRVDLLMPRRER